MTTKLWPLAALLLAAPARSPIGPRAEHARATPPTTARTDDAATLRRQTQELLDAVTHGTSAVWDHYLDSAVSFTTEDGDLRSKRDMVGEIRPLPKTITGKLVVTDFRATIHGDVAITTHVDDEHETFYGHPLHCQYRTTDTWKRTPEGWRLIASQVLPLRTDPPAIPLPAGQLDE